MIYRGPVWDKFKAGADGALGLSYDGPTATAILLILVALGFATTAILGRGRTRARWGMFWFAVAASVFMANKGLADVMPLIAVAFAAGALSLIANQQGRWRAGTGVLLAAWAVLACLLFFPLTETENHNGPEPEKLATRYESWVTNLIGMHQHPDRMLYTAERETIKRDNPESEENVEVPGTFALHLRGMGC